MVESAVGLIGVALFLVAVIALSLLYTDTLADGGQVLSETGALGMVASVAGFIVVMSVLGYWLSQR